jgi:hypothetical protein
MPRPIFLLALGLGGFFAVAALVLFCRTLWFVRRAVETEGRVSRYEVRETLEYSGGVRFSGSYPVIAYEDAAGRAHEFVSSVPALEGMPTRLPVLYIPADPARAEQRHFRAQWFGALLLLGLGVIFAGGAVLVNGLLRPR